jgi:hypothetical protein
MSQKIGRRLKNTVVIIQYSDTSIDLACLMQVRNPLWLDVERFRLPIFSSVQSDLLLS